MTTHLKGCICLLLSLVFIFSSTVVKAEEQEVIDICWQSFERTRKQVTDASSQSVIIQTDSRGLIPYITLHDKTDKGESYNLWQSLNGEIRGYALKGNLGFDYINTLSQISPITWHPTLIWHNLFASKKPIKNYTCVLTGRTRVMGKKVSLIRLVPQDGLRYTYLIAKDDETDFPVELTISDTRGFVPMRLTVVESRIIMGMDFPLVAKIFEDIEQKPVIDSRYLQSTTIPDLGLTKHPVDQSNSLSQSVADQNIMQDKSILFQEEGLTQDQVTNPNKSAVLAEMTKPTPSATMTGSAPQNHLLASELSKIKTWEELNIPNIFRITKEDNFPEGGKNCIYQEFTDGITSFRVYRNDSSTLHFPLLNNATLTIYRKNSGNKEYTVVGEVTVALAEYVLSKID